MWGKRTRLNSRKEIEEHENEIDKIIEESGQDYGENERVSFVEFPHSLFIYQCF